MLLARRYTHGGGGGGGGGGGRNTAAELVSLSRSSTQDREVETLLGKSVETGDLSEPSVGSSPAERLLRFTPLTRHLTTVECRAAQWLKLRLMSQASQMLWHVGWTQTLPTGD